MVTMEDTQGREYEINPDGVEALEALGWTRIGAESDEATASGGDGDGDAGDGDGDAGDGDGGDAGAESDEATASDDAAPAAPRRGRPRKK